MESKLKELRLDNVQDVNSLRKGRSQVVQTGEILTSAVPGLADRSISSVTMR